MRAAMSVPPPGANPTMSVTGRVGNAVCAIASVATSATAASSSLLMASSSVLDSLRLV